MRIGIDLGGTKIEGIVIDDDGRVVETIRIDTPEGGVYTAILEAIKSLVDDLESKVNARCAVGIGTPGALSSRTGALKNSNTVCLNGKPLKHDLERLLGRQLRMENDANCFTLSEATDGAARDYSVVFGVIIGTGVGGGIVIHKRLHSGPQHIAGEWGHNVLVADGPRCYCGRSGCVETYLSGPGLARLWADRSGGNMLSAPQIVDLARQEDVTAIAVMADYYRLFGAALASVINILDPDAIVLGGGMSNIEGLYTAGLEQVTLNVFNDELTTPILPNLHGDSSGVRGAAHLWAPTK